MRRVVLDMQNRLFSDAISSEIERYDPDFEVYVSETTTQTESLCMEVQANILIMEVSSNGLCGIMDRMQIRNHLKRALPQCKIVLMVDEETDSKLADRVKQAKKDDLIDGFLYGSVSSAYLTAMIDTF